MRCSKCGIEAVEAGTNLVIIQSKGYLMYLPIDETIYGCKFHPVVNSIYKDNELVRKVFRTEEEQFLIGGMNEK